MIKEKLDRTTVFMPASLSRRLQAFCLVENKQKGEVIREALIEYLNKRKFAMDGKVTIVLPPLS